MLCDFATYPHQRLRLLAVSEQPIVFCEPK